MTAKEMQAVGKYIDKHHIKPVNHSVNVAVEKTIDLTCPFLDTSKKKEKCLIYEARPAICKKFICCNPPSSHSPAARREFNKSRIIVDMWDIFGGIEK